MFQGGLPLLWAISACSSVPGMPSGMLDFECDELGPVHGAPTEWVTVSPEYEAYTTWLDHSPYRSVAHESDVEDLTVFDGALYAGLGDASANTGSRFCAELGGECPYEDAPGHGIPVYTFPPGSDRGTWDHIVREEEIVLFRRTGRSLLVPGVDPTEGDYPLACLADDAERPCPPEPEHPLSVIGQFHTRDDGVWREGGPLEAALHVYDNIVVDGRIWASGCAEPWERSLSGFAAVWSSDDRGASWDLEVLDDNVAGARRLTALLPLDGVIVGLGYHDDGRFPVRYVGTDEGWSPAPDLAPKLDGYLFSELVDRNLGVAWSRDGVAYALRAEGRLAVATEVTWFAERGRRVVDAHALCPGDLIVLSRSLDDGGDWAVHRTADLEAFEEVLAFRSDARFSSVAAWEGTLVFGANEGRLFRTPTSGTAGP